MLELHYDRPDVLTHSLNAVNVKIRMFTLFLAAHCLFRERCTLYALVHFLIGKTTATIYRMTNSWCYGE